MSNPKKLLKEREGYAESITRFLNSHKAGTIDALRIRFDLTQQHRRYIDRWIDIAVMKKVKRLELDVKPCRLNNRRGSETYLFGWKFSSSSEIRFLTGLCLKHVVVSGRILESFLSNCPLLETLNVAHSNRLTRINVCGPSLRLKHLHISFCNSIKSIEIYAPNLVCFEYRGKDNIALHINLKHVPQLCDVSYAGQWDQCFEFQTRKCIPSFLPTFQLVNLTLQIPPEVIEKQPRSPYKPEFPNLRYLTYEVRNYRHPYACTTELNFLVRLTLHMPLLCKLKVEVEAMEVEILTEEDGWWPITLGCLYGIRIAHLRMLQELEIVGFVGDAAVTFLLCCLIFGAPNLDTIVVNRSLPCWDGAAPVDEGKMEQLEEGRRFALEVLSQERPEGTKYVVL